MKKEIYEKPIMEISLILQESVITGSVPDPDGYLDEGEF